MAEFICMNHPHKQAVAQCRRCGKPVCEECYDPATGYCHDGCTQNGAASSAHMSKKYIFLQVIVAILAIIGGLAVLLITICGALLLSY